jgi:L,D-transpeptidase catalytic domain
VGATHSRLHHSVRTLRSKRPVASFGAAGPAASASGGRRGWSGRLLAAAITGACLTSAIGAQEPGRVPVQLGNQMEDSAQFIFKSSADSIAWERARFVATTAPGLKVVVSLRDRRVSVMRGSDTVRTVKAAVASGMTIEFGGRSWTFRTPRGRHTVLRKIENPVWSPPDWMYAEAAIAHNLQLARLRPERPIRVDEEHLLVLRGGRAGLLNRKSGKFAPLPTDEHIVFNDTLYVPPFVTENRRVPGELGSYALDLGDGYLIHGTNDPKSIGRAVTHGCIRLADLDIAWMYQYIPTGTSVHIY